MNFQEIRALTRDWDSSLSDVMNLKDVDNENLKDLFKSTYRTLRKYYRDELVPKEICELLLQMEEWLEFICMIDESPYSALYQQFHILVSKLKEGFFKGEFRDDIFEKSVDELNEKEQHYIFILRDS